MRKLFYMRFKTALHYMFEPSGPHERNEQCVDARHQRCCKQGREDHLVRVVVLTGAGLVFVRGDLQQVADDGGAQRLNSNDSEQLGGTFNRALVDLMECPVPDR